MRGKAINHRWDYAHHSALHRLHTTLNYSVCGKKHPFGQQKQEIPSFPVGGGAPPCATAPRKPAFAPRREERI